MATLTRILLPAAAPHLVADAFAEVEAMEFLPRSEVIIFRPHAARRDLAVLGRTRDGRYQITHHTADVGPLARGSALARLAAVLRAATTEAYNLIVVSRMKDTTDYIAAHVADTDRLQPGKGAAVALLGGPATLRRRVRVVNETQAVDLAPGEAVRLSPAAVAGRKWGLRKETPTVTHAHALVAFYVAAAEAPVVSAPEGEEEEEEQQQQQQQQQGHHIDGSPPVVAPAAAVAQEGDATAETDKESDGAPRSAKRQRIDDTAA